MAISGQKRTVAFRLLLGLLAGLVVAVTSGESPETSSQTNTIQAAGSDGYDILISDSLFLYASSVLEFDVQSFLDSQAGPLGSYVEVVDGQIWTAADSIQYNAMFYGLNPQLVLTLLEALNQLVTDPEADVARRPWAQSEASAQSSFYSYTRQVSEQALLAYDGHRYGEAATRLAFPTGETITLADAPNAGTYAVQATLAGSMSRQEWDAWAKGSKPLFVQRFSRWFGDPFLAPDRAQAAANATPSGYMLPFPVGETWYYTGGPHYYGGGVPGCVSGYNCPRPWSSLDIAQPELIACPGGYYPAHRWIVAAKAGNVIQSSQALIVIDHGDGWRTYYSHVSSADKQGTGFVERGDLLGHPSCEVEPGGFTTGVHVHFALYQVGTGFVEMDGRSFSGWVIGETSHYNGTMQLGGDVREASTGRYAGLNDILNSGVGGSCPIDGGILLYKHINYDCDGGGPGSGYILQSETGFQDLPGSFNDQASSIRVPPGWSVRLYQHTGRRGASVCRSGDDPDLTGDTFEGSAIPLNDQISSIEGFAVDDCSGPYEGGAWAATYFDGVDLTDSCHSTTIESSYVFADWGSDGPGGTCPADNWSARFTRHAYFPAGDYTFGLSADDLARLKIDGLTVIDNWAGTESAYRSQTLAAGSHEVTVEYADLPGDAYLSAWWWGQGYDMPRDSQQPKQWYARYWANRKLSGEPVALVNEGSETLDHSWEAEGPGYQLPADRFSGRFERQIALGCGSYDFRLRTDDGVRFWIDDQLLLDAWYDQVGTHHVMVDLETGYHELRIEHYENGGLATIGLDWTWEWTCPLPEKFYLPFLLTAPPGP